MPVTDSINPKYASTLSTENPSVRAAAIDRLMLGIWLPLLVVIIVVPAWWDAAAYGHWLTVQTIRAALAGYFAFAWLALGLCGEAWLARSGAARAARWFWSLGWLTFAVHVILAFHYYHHWSHAHAVQHTREVSGWGEGIFISHLFNILWLVDVLWWNLAAAGYARRPAWIGWLLHAFLAFIVFNGTVVYETGAVRWTCLLAFVVLAGRWLAVYIARRRSSPTEHSALAACRQLLQTG